MGARQNVYQFDENVSKQISDVHLHADVTPLVVPILLTVLMSRAYEKHAKYYLFANNSKADI